MLGILYSSWLRDDEKAEAAFRKAVTEGHEDAQGCYLLGSFLLRAGKLGEARTYLEQSIRLDSKRPESLMELGKLFLRQDDLTKAEASFNIALELATGSAMLHSLLGQVQLQKKNLPGALETFQRAVELEPGNAALSFAIAERLGEEAGALPQAIAYQEAGVRLSPAVATGWIELGNFHLRAGDPGKALEAFEQADRSSPGNASLTASINGLRFQANLKWGLILAILFLVGLRIAFSWRSRGVSRKTEEKASDRG